jgi:exopolyphosphatase/guanosine-5'-triphosphate,3'-diphosphate pyrophosphatase
MPRSRARPPSRRVFEQRRSIVGVIDIGSNSLRLVLYDGNSRAPQILFNEKVMCALGRGLNATGRLNPAGVDLARDNVERFVALSRRLAVADLYVLATSAVRDASDGQEFVAMLEALCDIRIQVISGEEEARLAAAGVHASIPDADGITGDLGGGSVELVTTGSGLVFRATSLPLGPLRLLGAGGDEAAPRAEVDRAIASVDWLGFGRGRTFYAVGGAWRALAGMHIEQTEYPLHMVQHYQVQRAELEGFLDVVSRLSRRSLDKITGVARRRAETLPLSAYVLQRLLRAIDPKSVVFSATGLREGYLYSLLSATERAQDPLLVGAARVAWANPRFGVDEETIIAWTDALFPEATAADRRLRRAAALLSDIGWTEHPDYRAEQAFTRCLRMPLPGVDHPGRVFIAAIIHARYGGDPDDPLLQQVSRLLDPDKALRARAAGQAFRLAYTLTGGAPGLIHDAGLALEAGQLVLTIPEHTAIYTGEAVQRRLDALGRTLGCSTALKLKTPPVPRRRRA